MRLAVISALCGLVLLGAATSGKGGAANAPEQIHLALGHTSAEVTVSWVTPDAADTVVFYRATAADPWQRASGNSSQYTAHCSGSRTPTYTYVSGFIHHARLTGLLSGVTYSYRVGDPGNGGVVSDEHTFTTMPPETGGRSGSGGWPFSVGVVGDLGQTNDSQSTVEHLRNDPKIRFVINIGDMSYADCDHRRWDSWGRMVEPLVSTVPLMVLPGNHEIEADHVANTSFMAYKARFLMPQAAPTRDTTAAADLPPDCAPSVYTGHFDYGNAFYAVTVANARYYFLSSYTTSDPSSPQYQWLQADLAGVDRTATPWVVVSMHAPFYSSNQHHYGEANAVAMREHLEPLLGKYGVDLVLSGHVHAYERSHPVYLNQTSPAPGGKGWPTYVVIGDGGNREGHCPEYNPQPDWSAFRDGTHFGHGRLTFYNQTHLHFEWFRNDDPEFVVMDETWIVKQ